MKTDIHHYKTVLETERKTLLAELHRVSNKDDRTQEEWDAKPDNIDALRSDSNEVGDKIESYESNVALVSQLELRLREIDDALDRITHNNFGICNVCNKEIEEKRLQANPAATTCIEHKDN